MLYISLNAFLSLQSLLWMISCLSVSCLMVLLRKIQLIGWQSSSLLTVFLQRQTYNHFTLVQRRVQKNHLSVRLSVQSGPIQIFRMKKLWKFKFHAKNAYNRVCFDFDQRSLGQVQGHRKESEKFALSFTYGGIFEVLTSQKIA